MRLKDLSGLVATLPCVMNRYLAESHHISKRSTIWFSYLIVLLVLVMLLMIVMGYLNLDLDIGSIEAVNPAIAVIVTGLLITAAWYVVTFALSLPIVFIWSLISTSDNNS